MKLLIEMLHDACARIQISHISCDVCSLLCSKVKVIDTVALSVRTQGLNRLYLTVFQSINEIYVELGKHVPFHIKEKKEKKEFLNQDLMFQFQESKVYEKMINEFHECDLDREYDSVMSNLFRACGMNRDWKDYRAALLEK
jgi:hypothetical protein